MMVTGRAQDDHVTTAAPLAQAASGRWHSGTASAGVYL
jgi:hypothetical protein